MIKKIRNLISFLNHGIWDMDNLPDKKFKKLFYKQIRIIILAIKGYLKHNGNLSASALTFFSLLSVVPVLAMAFGVAKGFGLDNILEEEIRKNLYGQGEVVEKLIEFSRTMLQNTNGGIVAGIGFVIVFYSVLKLLNSIEEIFNKAWEVRKPRSFYRKFTDYTSFIVIAPVLFTVSSSISVFVISRVETVTDGINMIGVINEAITLSLELLSFALIWLLMILIYMLMPNTKVSWKAGIQSGIVIGTLFIIVQWVYVNFQLGVSRANAIYGSFAALPLFLVWLQTSWFIIIFGAEYSYAVQYEYLFRNNGTINKLSSYNFRKVALLTTHKIVKDFVNDKPATPENVIAKQLNISKPIADKILLALLKGRIIIEIKSGNNRRFQPAMDINKLTVTKVLAALEHLHKDKWQLVSNKENEKIEAIMRNFKEITAEAGSNKLLVDI